MNPVGRSILNRHQNQSFSLSPQERERISIIHYTLLCLNSEDLVAQLQRSIVSAWPNPDVVNKLYETLLSVGVIQSHMIAGANDEMKRHCVRCHRVYQECHNFSTSCVYKRPVLLETQDGSTEKEHIHRSVARHTTRVESVDYDNVHFFSCEIMNCAERRVPSRTPSPSSSCDSEHLSE